MIRLARHDEGTDPEKGQVRFAPGQLVRHVRYGYRGVVVSADHYCMAPDAWYYGNKTQPDRNQPWYHVLVHDTPTVTYAAQNSLEADDSGRPVRHPMVDHFFAEFDAGRYVRNDTPWPG